MTRKMITILEKATGKVAASFDAEDFAIARNSSKTKPRAVPKMTNAEFEALVNHHGKYEYRSTRVQAARLVMTEHLTVTEAARRLNIQPNNVWGVVAALEAHVATQKEFE